MKTLSGKLDQIAERGCRGAGGGTLPGWLGTAVAESSLSLSLGRALSGRDALTNNN